MKMPVAKEQAKALVSALTAFLATLLVVLDNLAPDAALSFRDCVYIAAATLAAYGYTWGVPNAPEPALIGKDSDSA